VPSMSDLYFEECRSFFCCRHFYYNHPTIMSEHKRASLDGAVSILQPSDISRLLPQL
jgi:hypothetical protein